MNQLERLRSIMHRLRRECPWDREQTHRSLSRHLIEETYEVIDAIELGSDADLREELGDVLLQVFFHAEIASETGRFGLEDVAQGVCDKLEHRHPWVFSDEAVPADMMATWEARKRRDKHRDSVLDGIPSQLPTLARAAKVVARIGRSGDAEPITADAAGQQIMAIVERAHASGVDIDQALRDACRHLEERVRAAEA